MILNKCFYTTELDPNAHTIGGIMRKAYRLGN